MRLLKKIILFGAALFIPVAALTTQGRPDPPLCQVQAAATRTITPGIYNVTISLLPDCPPDAIAYVRFESYVGGHYPRRGWFRVTRSTPLKRAGLLWYWRGAWQGKNGQAYPFVIPGMRAPVVGGAP